MANPMIELAAEAIELDAWVDEIADYQQHFDRFLTRLEKGARKINISNATQGGGVNRQPMRVPFRPQGGSAVQQATADASGSIFAWPRGTASQYDGFVASPVRLVNTCEISNLTQQATDGKDRGLVKIKREELQNSLKAFDNGVEGLIHRDGSGTIDAIPSTATVNNATGGGASGSPTYSSIVGLNTAASFTDQQTVQVLSAVGGTNRGSFTISYVDPVAQTIYSTAALPAGTTTGDILVVQGATGAAGSSILGKDYWLQNGNTGTIGGIPKANYPGRLSTPTINFNGSGTVTPDTAARITAIRMRAMGDDFDGSKGAFWLVNPSQAVSYGTNFYNPGRTDLQSGGDTIPDLAKKNFSKTFLGDDVVYATTAEPTRADYIVPDTWHMGVLFETRLHEWTPGNTVIAVPNIGGAAGTTYLDSQMFAYERGFQLVCQNPKENFYLQGLPVVNL